MLRKRLDGSRFEHHLTEKGPLDLRDHAPGRPIQEAQIRDGAGNR
ncbi:MAG: hypothetical protein SV429_02355 [Pseudomonadota bacterium]|nr:hypothetical protein [Pseudomonadota bacterium]